MTVQKNPLLAAFGLLIFDVNLKLLRSKVPNMVSVSVFCVCVHIRSSAL